MTTKRKRKPAPRTPAAPRAPDPQHPLPPGAEDIVLRLLACAMGLPRICALKTCRRAKRCLGAGVVCAEHHRGLVRARLPAAIKLIGTPGKVGQA